MELAGLYTIEHYINVRRNTLIQNIATRPILELCRDVVPLSGSSRRRMWWDQLEEVEE